MSGKHARGFHLLLAVGILVVDRLTKWIVASRLSLHDGVTVIPDFFRIVHVENPGAAFGLFAESSYEWRLTILILFSLLALVIVGVLLWKNSHIVSATGTALALILGGALGNLWDRIIAGHVTDFLEFHVGSYYWPSFNVADSAIVVGALLLVADILFAKAPERLSAKDEIRTTK
jgi:signal peptidase II